MRWVKFQNQEISDDGQIRRGGLLKKPSIRENGYLYLNFNGKKMYVHRLVAMAFIPNPKGLPQVNHKNGIKTDNRVENLEWCDSSYNNKHSFDFLGRKAVCGSAHRFAVLSEQDVISIRELSSTHSTKYLSELFKVDISGIRRIIKRQLWKHI